MFNVTHQSGLFFRGEITHLQSDELPNWTNGGRFVTWALCIGNVLYIVSNDMVKMNSQADLSELCSVNPIYYCSMLLLTPLSWASRSA